MTIRIQDLRVEYRGEKILNISEMEISNSTIVLGPNGSGKTTLFRTLSGLVDFRGTVLIDGLDLRTISAKTGLVATNLEDVYYIVYTDCLRLMKLYIDLMCGDLDLALTLMSELGLSKDVLRRRKLWQLSAGQRKIFCTTLALASKAKYVLLDEPFEQLDPSRKVRLVKYLLEAKSIVILNTHETWLLQHFKSWDGYLMFEGQAYGKFKIGDILDAYIVPEDREDSIVKLKVGTQTLSIVKTRDRGFKVSELATLDRVYEILAR